MRAQTLTRGLLLAGAVICLGAAAAHAQMAVYDGASYGQLVQEVTQAARQLASLNQQTALQSLMVTQLPAGPTGSPPGAQQIVSALNTPQTLSFGMGDAASFLDTHYGGLPAPPVAQASSLSAWQTATRAAFAAALNAEDAVIQAQPAVAASSDAAVRASQGAPGPTAAAQASNRLLAGLSTQVLELQGALIAGQRASEAARIEEQAVALSAPQESARVLAFSPPAPRLVLNGQI